MVECKYNYSIEDNLKATKILTKEKNRRRSHLGAILVIFFSVFGIASSIWSILLGENRWWFSIASIILLGCYFLTDVVFMNIALSKQRDFFNHSELKKITKIKIVLYENILEEIFYINEKEFGKNTYQLDNVTLFKAKDNNIYIIFDNVNIVLIKKDVLTNKNLLEFMKIYDKLNNKKKK